VEQRSQQEISRSASKGHLQMNAYISWTNKSHYIMVAVYVDDFLVASKTESDMRWLHDELNKSWETRDLGPVKRFLGIDVQHDGPTGDIFISQSVYAREILEEFGIENCNPAKTPFPGVQQLHKRRDDEEQADRELYRRIIGKIMHLMIYTRPNLAYAISKLSQYNSDPSAEHLAVAKHVLRYIRGTLDHGIKYSNDPNADLWPISYSDASFQSDPDDSKPHSGYVSFLSNGIISYKSHKQSCVAQSTMESEYIELSEASKDIIFLRIVLESLHLGREQPVVLQTDAQAAFQHVKNNVNHSRTKHFVRSHHFFRDAQEKGVVDIVKIPGNEQAADILTKPLQRQLHEKGVELLGLISKPGTMEL
jgi:hypothetical protein